MSTPDDRPSLFLSYARSDDEPFSKRLYERLSGEGFRVWWDRQDMPSRSLTFLKEIREAVRGVDRMVVVVGPRCVSSDYCRAEWQAALADAKVVNPVLRLGEHSLLPPELAGLHCPDFTDEARFESAMAELLRVLGDPIPSLGDLQGGVPDVPPHFQPRPDVTSNLANTLLVDERRPVVLTGPERVTVLHGMGGTGKSVLAAAFARSTTTRRSFGDGIYWLNAGQEATPLGLAVQLGRLLGTPLEGHGDLARCTTDLASALESRGVLVVMDNAWEVEPLEPLIDALGPSCRLLVTTRIGELAESIGAAEVELRELTPEAGLQHLADWTGVSPEELPKEAAAVAVECGHLPFALALNGAMHRQGVAWSDLLEALQGAEIGYAEQRFRGYEHPTVLSSIKVSVDALDREEPSFGERFRELAAFFGEGGVPEPAVSVLWAHTGELQARDVSKLLAKLAARALVRLEGPDAERRVLIHDLQRDYLLRISDIEAVNATLLDAYRKTLDRPDDWAGLPRGDAYIWAHLIKHLLTAQAVEDARRTVCDLAFLGPHIEEAGSLRTQSDLAAVAEALPDDLVVRELGTRLRQWGTTIEAQRDSPGLISTLHARLGTAGASADTLSRLATGPWLRHRYGLDTEAEALVRILEGHDDSVTAVAFSPDGSRLASGSRDGTVRLWDAHSGAELARLEVDQQGVSAVAFSPDGRRLASGWWDQSVRLWDAANGIELARLEDQGGPIHAVAFSPDGTRLASVSDDRNVRICDAESGSELERIKRPRGRGHAVAFSPDGSRLAASGDRNVRIWDAQSHTELARLKGHQDVVMAVAFSPEGSRLASASLDEGIRLWDAASGIELARLEGHQGPVYAVAFSPDGTRLATGSWDQSIRLWDAASGIELARLDGHQDRVTAVAFSPDGTRLASASDDRGVRIWDALSAPEPSRLSCHDDDVTAVAASPDGSRLASGSEDETVRLWDAASGAELARLEGDGAPVNSVAFSPDGTRLASASNDRDVRIWDAQCGSELDRIKGPRGWVHAVAFSPDGTRLASASRRSVRLWDAARGVELARLEGHQDVVLAVAFSPDGTRLASGSDEEDPTVRLWDAHSGAELARLEGHQAGVYAVAFSPDGTRLATGSWDQSIRLWDAASGIELARLDGHQGPVLAVAFSPDGTRLASASRDQSVRLWDVPGGVELCRISLAREARDLVWADSALIAAAGRDVVAFDVVE